MLRRTITPVISLCFMLTISFWYTNTVRNDTVAYPVSLKNTINGEQLPIQEVQFVNLDKEHKEEIECLAKNIYYESRGEYKLGWLAVAMVTMNRVNSGLFPTNICDVVYQKTGKVYQFSWVASRKHLTTPTHELYNEILDYAMAFYYKHHHMEDVTKGALFFHADYVNPRWNREKTAQIGRHIFYR